MVPSSAWFVVVVVKMLEQAAVVGTVGWAGLVKRNSMAE